MSTYLTFEVVPTKIYPPSSVEGTGQPVDFLWVGIFLFRRARRSKHILHPQKAEGWRSIRCQAGGRDLLTPKPLLGRDQALNMVVGKHFPHF